MNTDTHVFCRISFFEGKIYDYKVPFSELQTYMEVRQSAMKISHEDLALFVNQKFDELNQIEQELIAEVRSHYSSYDFFDIQKAPSELVEKINSFAIQKLNFLTWEFVHDTARTLSTS